MKNKTKIRPGILTALLAVLSIQGVEFKKRIGIIAVLGVLLLVSMPAQATQVPADCTGSSTKIIAIYKQPTLTVNGETIVNYAMYVGNKFESGGCNVGNTDSGETNHGLTVYFNKPPMDGKQPANQLIASGEELILDTDKSFHYDGTDDTCYYSSPIGKQMCDATFAPNEDDVSTRGLDMTWLTNVNPGVTDAIARGRLDCPSNACLHDATTNHDMYSTMDVGVDVTEIPDGPCIDECWYVEWFNTKPVQFTEFFLPRDQLYMVTSGFTAPEAKTHIWDGDAGNEELVDSHTGDRLKYWQDPNNYNDLYINKYYNGDCVNGECSYEETTLRIYGTFGEGPGTLDELDPLSGKIQENPGYTDPIAPFFPQADDAPRKDHVTFNPAIMENNFGYPELHYSVNGQDVQEAKEKVFQRMSYEKDWFKDDDADGKWDVVVEDSDGVRVASIPIDTWEQYYHDNLPESRDEGWRIREHNNHILTPGNQADTYGPAIIKEFTYMTLNTETLPILVDSGSRILIPTANSGGYGLNDFTYTGDSRDYVKVESEETLNMDIDGDGDMDPMDTDGQEVSGDESVVLVLADKLLEQGDDLQFFDNKIHITTVSTGNGGSIVYNVCDNEGSGTPTCTNNENLISGNVKFYTRGAPQANPSQPKGDFYIRLKNVDNTLGQPSAVIEVGRLFGNTLANIGANKYWNQKAFIVQGVFYNVVAIKAKENTFKFITFREKLPKEEIKLYGRELHVWYEGDILPEMPPFNDYHYIMEDVQSTHSWPIQKIGAKKEASALEIYYVDETKEERFKGELKEIYAESLNPLKEFWEVEWFHTMPEQYTEFVLPRGQLYLVTSGFYAPEAETHIWDGVPEDEVLVDSHIGDRLKFWFDPNDDTGLFINNDNGAVRLYGTFGEGPGTLDKVDPLSGKIQENPGYTDPISPFFPQADDAPRKDHITFNPAIMEHNFGYPELLFSIDGNTVQEAKEKVFQRMSYEKDWFKDDDADGIWDVVVEDSNGDRVASIPIDTWKQYYHDNLPDSRDEGWRLREHNNHILTPGNQADTYGPAIIKEFTYMTLNTETMPVLVESGSRILIPTANSGGYGLNDFTYTGDSRDYVKVESEATLNMDIDGDGDKDPMDKDGQEVSGDESVVFVLPDKSLWQGQDLQFFDNRIHISTVSTGSGGSIVYNVCDNEGGTPTCTNNENLVSGNVKFYARAAPPLNANTPRDFYIRLKNVDNTLGQPTAVIEVGRLFGHTLANIGANKYWNQKAFFVQGVFYNVVAIKTEDNTFKYITFREKLPKEDIKLYGRDLRIWYEGEVLPEMPPFNDYHAIMEDVQSTHTWPIQKIGEKRNVYPLQITYGIEAKEPRFFGELKEIYAEPSRDQQQTGPCILPNGKDLDVNNDDTVGIGDVIVLTNHWAAKSTDADWNNHKFADLNNDDVVGIGDVIVLTNYWAKSCV